VKTATEVGRYELKYVLPEARRNEIMDFVRPHARPDPYARPMNGGYVGYTVHSLYLDTPRLDDYFERLEGKKIRSRLRVRTYGEPGEGQPVFLENKRKSGKWVVKHRVRVCDAETWCGCSVPRPWTTLARKIAGQGAYAARSFCQLVDGGGRQPVTTVHYEREVLIPLQDDGRHVRLTLDHRVRATVTSSASNLFAPSDVELIPPEWLVMELKFENAAPRWMIELCRQLEVHSIPVTKFGLSVALGVRRNRAHELRLLTPRPLIEQRDSA